jgi:hypothetical protein
VYENLETEAVKIKAENLTLKTCLLQAQNAAIELSSKLERLTKENEIMKEALLMAIDSASFFQKFADCRRDSWSCRCEFCRDTSKTKNLTRAREALKKIEEIKTN